MRTILFIENGTSGGGSFESLYQIVTHLDVHLFRFVVVFVNENIYIKQLQKKGIPTFVLRDPLYSAKTPRLSKAIAARLFSFAHRFFPQLIFFLNRFFRRDILRQINALIDRYHVDCIHVNNHPVRDLYAIQLARARGIPCVSAMRSVRTAPLYVSVARFLNQSVDFFIANSAFTKKFWTTQGITQEKIRIVYNAISFEIVHPLDIRTLYNIAPAVQYLVGTVGNFTEGKGQELLLKAFTHVLLKESRVRLLMVGDGANKRKCIRLANALGIAPLVIFAGYDARAKAIIAALDVYILPSQHEAFGRTLLEAMVAETPIIATDCGGIPEVIRNRENGILVPYGDSKALASAILHLLHDRALADALIQAGRHIVRTVFGMDEHILKFEAIYKEVIFKEGRAMT